MNVYAAITEIVNLVPVRELAVACPRCHAMREETCVFVAGDPDMPRPVRHPLREAVARMVLADLLAVIARRE